MLKAEEFIFKEEIKAKTHKRENWWRAWAWASSWEKTDEKRGCRVNQQDDWLTQRHPGRSNPWIFSLCHAGSGEICVPRQKQCTTRKMSLLVVRAWDRIHCHPKERGSLHNWGGHIAAWNSGNKPVRKWRGAKKPLDESERGEQKSWLKAQHSENKDHGIQSHHFMGNRLRNSGNSVRLYFGGLQNHCRWWLQP